MELCLWCNKDVHKPPQNYDYICGDCTQDLFGASKEQLLHAYNLSEEKGLKNKMRAIESFLAGTKGGYKKKSDKTEISENEINEIVKNRKKTIIPLKI